MSGDRFSSGVARRRVQKRNNYNLDSRTVTVNLWEQNTQVANVQQQSLGASHSVPNISGQYRSEARKTGSDLRSSVTPQHSSTEELTFGADLPPTIENMPCRERTAEFRTTAKSFQMKRQAAAMPNGLSSQKPQRIVNEAAQFNQMAKRVGRDLSQTCAKLEKLAALARKRSLFDDRVSEVEELTIIIKQDIGGLNKQIALLQEFAVERAEATHTPRAQGQNHSKSVVVGLQSRLAAVSTEFKQVLEVRTENLKQQKSRREQFSHSQPVPSSLPPSASTGHMGSVLLSDDAASANGSVTLDMDQLERSRVQQQIQLIDEQDQYLQARSTAMESIESSISELGSIFRQLAHLVSEQGETIQRIDSNVDETSLHVEAAHMELLKYFRNISRNRWLAIKVFGVLIVFFIIFIVFLT